MRKLASIQLIKELAAIEGADRIEVATINGWKVVVGKGDFKVGDSCVYFEIDSVLPLEHFPELEKVKGRIKTIRLRGQISQGYCITVDRFWEIADIIEPGLSKDVGFGIVSIREGSDVTNYLQVTKYEPPIKFSSGDSAGSFPGHILAKTDEDRIQSNLEYLEKMEGLPWVATVKYDGTSATFGLDEGDFIACSRNLKVKDGNNVYWNIARRYKLAENIPDWAMVQGEICGPGIQKNPLKLKEIEFFVFRVYNKVEKQYLKYDERFDFCYDNVLLHVNYADCGDSFDFTLEELLEFAEGTYSSGRQREGVVIECDEYVHTEFGGHLSFKVINNKFLLK